MKTVIILASPNPDGKIKAMLDVVREEGEKRKYEIDFIDLYKKHIEYCRGCCICKSTGRCPIDDDIAEIRQSIVLCDLIIVGCPTYFANVTAPLKNMFDRLVSVAMDDSGKIPKPRLSKKQKYVLITSCNTIYPFDRIFKQSTGTIRAMKEFFNISGMKYGGKIILPGAKYKTALPNKTVKKLRKAIR